MFSKCHTNTERFLQTSCGYAIKTYLRGKNSDNFLMHQQRLLLGLPNLWAELQIIRKFIYIEMKDILPQGE